MHVIMVKIYEFSVGIWDFIKFIHDVKGVVKTNKLYFFQYIYFFVMKFIVDFGVWLKSCGLVKGNYFSLT